jgi:hypothetical protein
MTLITYHDHSIEVVSTQDPTTRKWTARAIVSFMGMGGPLVHPVDVSSAFETREAAELAAEQKAIAWIDQAKS